MLNTSVLLLVLLAGPGQGMRAAEMAPIMDVPQCTVPVVDYDASLALDVVEAPEGGSWWIQREGAYTQLVNVPEAIELRDGGGAEVVVDVEVREGAVRIPIPEDALTGDSYLLASAISNESVVLRVTDLALVDELVVESATLSVLSVDQDTCFVDCDRDGQTVPRAPVVDVVYSGGPAAITVRFETDGFLVHEAAGNAPLVRDLILEHAPSPRAVSFTIEQFIQDDASASASVEIVPLFGGAAYTAQTPQELLEAVPFEGESRLLQTCDEAVTQEPMADCSCGSLRSGRPAFALLAAFALVGLARRPRRRVLLRP